jgi:hypothetical protein
MELAFVAEELRRRRRSHYGGANRIANVVSQLRTQRAQSMVLRIDRRRLYYYMQRSGKGTYLHSEPHE